MFIALAVLAWDKTRDTSESAEETPTSDSAAGVSASATPPAPAAAGNVLPSQNNAAGPISNFSHTPELSSSPTQHLVNILRNIAPPAAPLSPSGNERDIFAPGRPFISSRMQAERQPALPPLHLQSILIRPGRNLAMLNGEVVAEGDRLGNITIIRIASDNVQVRCEGRLITIMPDITPPTTSQIQAITEISPNSQPVCADSDNTKAVF